MCGISGVLLANANTPAVGEIYESLNILQHRGQVWFDFDGRLTKKGRRWHCHMWTQRKIVPNQG
jgi:amidophosphoribosyltransferase